MERQSEEKDSLFLENAVADDPVKDLGTISRALLWLHATKELLHPPQPDQNPLLFNTTTYSEIEFRDRDVHIFGDSYAQGHRDLITLANGKKIKPLRYPAPRYIVDRLRTNHGVHWRIHNHAIGGSTTNAAREQVLSHRGSGQSDQSQPDYYTQVGGIDFIALMNRPQVNKDIVTLSRLFQENTQIVDLLRSKDYLQEFYHALCNIPLVVNQEINPFKSNFKRYLEELIFGGKTLPRRTFVCGQPDGGMVNLLEAQMLAVHEDHRENVIHIASQRGKGIVSFVASNTSKIIETAAQEVALQVVTENQKLLDASQSQVLFIHYRDRVQRKHISTEHLKKSGQIEIARVIMERCFYKGRPLSEWAA